MAVAFFTPLDSSISSDHAQADVFAEKNVTRSSKHEFDTCILDVHNKLNKEKVYFGEEKISSNLPK